MDISSSEIKIFQRKILTWYKIHERDLPWRRTRDPYKILISEIMLQQTQVPRVIQKFNEWIEKFPTLTSLARSSTADVLASWSGLGYNRRAVNLKRTAEILMNEYNGRFPDSEKELLWLPGIGKYTANAILCFAFNKQVAVVDINIKKVIIVEFLRKRTVGRGGVVLQDVSREIDQLDDALAWKIAQQLLPVGLAYEWNQALMDYSSSVLKKEKIFIPKQSPFKGSRRYYRGKILKLVLAQKTIHISALEDLLEDDFSGKSTGMLESILDELQKEKFIIIENRVIRFVN